MTWLEGAYKSQDVINCHGNENDVIIIAKTKDRKIAHKSSHFQINRLTNGGLH